MSSPSTHCVSLWVAAQCYSVSSSAVLGSGLFERSSWYSTPFGLDGNMNILLECLFFHYRPCFLGSQCFSNFRVGCAASRFDFESRNSYLEEFSSNWWNGPKIAISNAYFVNILILSSAVTIFKRILKLMYYLWFWYFFLWWEYSTSVDYDYEF